MIVNRAEPKVAEKLQRETAANPMVRVVCTAADACPDPFELDAEAPGFEIRALARIEGGLPNRARMKVLSPKPDHTLVFFYKRSLVPYSRDRYSYGGIDLRIPQVSDADVTDWLRFLSSGFHPEKRPAQLRRAFPYEIPE